MTIGFSSSGSWDGTDQWLQKMKDDSIFEALSHYGQEGVDALSRATPVDSGETAAGWYYEIINDGKSWSIVWGNNHMEGGSPIAVLLQYGHGTGDGGYVQGIDYINPALRPIFDRIEAEAWKAVTS